jgi:excisionase family DNA binding protein
MQERWLSVEEVAEHLGVNPDTTYNWVDRREMPARKLDRLMTGEAAKGTPLPTENSLRAKRFHA